MYLCSPIDADLHNHTRVSDGEYTPSELVEAARKLNLSAVGITDHDTIDGIPEALNAARGTKMEIVCGAEITVRFTDSIFRGSLHLLIYFSERLLKNTGFVSDTRKTLEQGRGPALTEARIRSINTVFGPEGTTPVLPRNLTSGDIRRHGTRISRRHFALALNDLGITDKDAVAGILGNASPTYIPSGIPLDALRGYLSRWPLVRILAHPAAGSYPGDSHYKEVLPPLETVERFIPSFMELGLDGLEICYPGHTPALIEKLETIRCELNLPLATGGSDCHDDSDRQLGKAGIPASQMNRLRDFMERRYREYERAGFP